MEGASGLEDSLFAHPGKRKGEIREQVLNSGQATSRVVRRPWLLLASTVQEYSGMNEPSP